MKTSTNVVSIRPYFKVHEGKLDAFKAYFPQFVERVANNETKCLYFDLTVSGDVVAAREAYVGAEGVLAHLENVGDLIGKILELSDLTRLELHGPAVELEKLKEPLASFSPQFFIYECGLK